jgi:tripartite-type tricarboxylate transporter receptor subunit TctC
VADQENTIGTVTGSGGAIIGALTPNENIKYDLTKFNWLFATNDMDNPVYCIWATNKNGLTDINQMLVPGNKFVYGTQDVSSGESNIQLYIVKNILGIKSNIVVGYKDTRQAILNGEIDARFSSLSGQLTLTPNILSNNSEIKPILQLGSNKRNSLIPNVPLLEEMVKNEDHKKVLNLFTQTNKIARPYFSGPKMSEKRVKEINKAVEDMEKDLEYQAEFKTLNKVIKYQEFNGIIKDIVATDKKVLELIK